MKPIAEALMNVRARLRLSNQQLSDVAGVSTKTVTRWMQWDLVPPADQREALVAFVARIDTNEAQILARALGVHFELPQPPALLMPAIVLQTVAPGPSSAQIAETLFTAAEQFEIAPRTLRLVARQLVATWETRNWTMAAVREGIDQLAANAAAKE